MNYYNEIDPQASAWLRMLIREGVIPFGVVDTRSIEEVQPSDLSGYTHNATSSPVLASGRSHLVSQAGRKTSVCGPDRVPASRSAKPENKKVLMTKDTSGPTSSDSSPHANLQRCLESRLRARLAAYGSPEYALTWKHWPMKSGPAICALRGLALPKSDRGYTGWPTPLVNDQLGSTHCYGKKPSDGSERKRFLKLPGAVRLMGWATPTVTQAGGTPTVTQAGGTPQGFLRRKSRAQGSEATAVTDLNLQAIHLFGWPTPHCPREHDSDNSASSYTDRLLGAHLTPISEQTGTRAALNPAHSRWLMGLPRVWDVCAVMAMPSSRNSRPNSSKQRKKPASELI